MVISSRWYMVPASVLFYGSCIVVLIGSFFASGGLGEAVGGRRSRDRCQMSDVRKRQKSEVRCQMSEVGKGWIELMHSDGLNIVANRRAQKYSGKENFRRVLWAFVSLLFRYSPRPFFGWRRWLLRLFGAKVGREVHIYSSAVIYMPWNFEIGDWSSIGECAFIYNLGQVRIGSCVTVSHRAHLCAGTHDYTDATMPLLKTPISVGDQAWVCADAYVGPGVTIGEGAVVGARAVVVKDVPSWMVVTGNPAGLIGKRIVKNDGDS